VPASGATRITGPGLRKGRKGDIVNSILPAVDGVPLANRPLLHSSALAEAEALLGRLLDPRSLRPTAGAGRADLRFNHAALRHMRLFGVHHGVALHVRSAPLRAYQVMVPLHGSLRARVGDTALDIQPGSALVYSAGATMNTYWSADCTALVTSIPHASLAGFARRLLPAVPEPLILAPRLCLQSGPGRTVANLLGCLCAESDAGRGGPGTITEGLEELVLLALLQAQPDLMPQVPPGAGSAHRRRQGVERCLAFIHANPGEEIRLERLLALACISLRSLQIGFTERFGVGPMTYIRRRRLERARADLLAATPARTAVGEVAARWGFYNASSFSRLYRAHFGESPSTTLARSP